MLIPIADGVLVLGNDDPDYWDNSTIIQRPESTKDRCDQGFVKAIGPAVKDVQVGDYVTFSPYTGKLIDDADEGKKLILLREEAVMSIVTPPTTIVDGVTIMTDQGPFPATAEALLLLVREAYHKIPRIIQMKEKWEQRNKDMGEE